MRDIIFVLLLLTFGVSTAQVDIKRQGYYQVIVSDTVYSQHSQEYQAIETLLNLSYEQINANVIAPTLTVDADLNLAAPDTIEIIKEIPVVQYDTVFIDNEQPVLVNAIDFEGRNVPIEDIFFVPETVTDTIYATECFEDYNKKTWLWTTPEHVWIPFKEIGLAHTRIDSMPVWKKKYQNKYKLQRVRNHKLAQTGYKELEMPFQFFHDSIVSIDESMVRVRVFANEDWYPELYVDDQLWKELPDAIPGTQNFDGFNTRRHTITFDGLMPQTNYVLSVKGYSRLRKEEDIIYFTITTK